MNKELSILFVVHLIYMPFSLLLGLNLIGIDTEYSYSSYIGAIVLVFLLWNICFSSLFFVNVLIKMIRDSKDKKTVEK